MVWVAIDGHVTQAAFCQNGHLLALKTEKPKGRAGLRFSHVIQTWPLCLRDSAVCVGSCLRKLLPSVRARRPPTLRAPSCQLKLPRQTELFPRTLRALLGCHSRTSHQGMGTLSSQAWSQEQRRGISLGENEGSVARQREQKLGGRKQKDTLSNGFFRLPGSLSSSPCDLGQVLTFHFFICTMGVIPQL